MRLFRLILLGLLVYVISVVVLFPAAPVVERAKPYLGPVALEGVNGKLYKGVIDRVRSTDDLLPLEFQNVGWAVAPKSLLNGGAGATFSFDGYGGSGKGLLTRAWNGDVVVSDFNVTAQAKELEPLLPVPIASFSGELSGSIAKLALVNNLLNEMNGSFTWANAVLESPIRTSLGTVQIQITPQTGQTHQVALSANGGDVTMDGQVTLAQNGDFVADVLFTPAPSATPDVINGLRQMGRLDAQGRVRLQRQGNVNRLM